MREVHNSIMDLLGDKLGKFNRYGGRMPAYHEDRLDFVRLQEAIMVLINIMVTSEFEPEQIEMFVTYLKSIHPTIPHRTTHDLVGNAIQALTDRYNEQVPAIEDDC